MFVPKNFNSPPPPPPPSNLNSDMSLKYRKAIKTFPYTTPQRKDHTLNCLVSCSSRVNDLKKKTTKLQPRLHKNNDNVNNYSPRSSTLHGSYFKRGWPTRHRRNIRYGRRIRYRRYTRYRRYSRYRRFTRYRRYGFRRYGKREFYSSTENKVK